MRSPRNDRQCLTLAATVLLMCSCLSAIEAQEVLRWKFQKGQELHYVMEQKMDTKINVMGRDLGTTMTQIMDIDWIIKSVDEDGTAQMIQTISRIRLKLNGPTLNVDYDTKSGERPDNPLAQNLTRTFDALAGGEFTMTMSSQGEVKDAKLPKKFEEALAKNPQGGAAIGISPDSMKQMMAKSGIVFPKEAVKKGSSWMRPMEVKLPFGQMIVTNQFVYDGKQTKGDRSLERITLKPTLTLKPNPDSPFMINLKSQDSNGEIFFDKSAGSLIESSMKQNMVMQIMAGGQNIAQTTNTTVTMRLVEGPDVPE